jgi:hypothetical protein
MTTSNGFAGKDDFFAATKRRFKEVNLPSGMTTRIRSLSAGEWADFEMGSVNKAKGGGFNFKGLRNSDFRLIAASVVDGDGNLIFTDADIPQLETLDAADSVALSRAIKEHSGLTRDVEDAQKNLSGTNGGSSPASS